MMDLIKVIPGLIKFKRVGIDNNVFRLHYVATTMLLMSLSILLSSKQYFGDPINCITKSGVPVSALNSYCWMFSTFSVKKHFEGELGKEIAHPGVSVFVDKEDEVIHHKYYQWVSLVLFWQGCLFYLPHYLWKKMEGGVVRMLVGEDLEFTLMNNKWNEERRTKMADYITGSNLHHRGLYALKFTLTELLNICNVVSQIYFLNHFLGQGFFLYGPLAVYNNQGDNPMTRLFPKVAKCTFYDYGPSGSTQINDALCVLPLNIINERVFVLLWFWLFTLGVISVLYMFYRMFLLTRIGRVYILSSYARFVQRSKIQLVVDECHFGDWFLLTLVGNNMNPISFQDLIEDVASKLKSRSTWKLKAKLKTSPGSDKRLLMSAITGDQGVTIEHFTMNIDETSDDVSKGMTRRRVGDKEKPSEMFV